MQPEGSDSWRQGSKKKCSHAVAQPQNLDPKLDEPKTPRKQQGSIYSSRNCTRKKKPHVSYRPNAPRQQRQQQQQPVPTAKSKQVGAALRNSTKISPELPLDHRTFLTLSALFAGLTPPPSALSLLGMGASFSVQLGSELV